jgi:spore coat protein U-like protein
VYRSHFLFSEGILFSIKRAQRGILVAAGCCAISLASASLPAIAGTVTSNVAVSATVNTNCSMGVASVPFGVYDPLVVNASTIAQATGTISISCTKGTTATITLDNGQNASHASGTTRAMISGANYLSYELYTSAAHSTVWNATNSVLYTSTGTGAGTVNVYGTIPAGQNANTGSYADTVIATASF